MHARVTIRRRTVVLCTILASVWAIARTSLSSKWGCRIVAYNWVLGLTPWRSAFHCFSQTPLLYHMWERCPAELPRWERRKTGYSIAYAVRANRNRNACVDAAISMGHNRRTSTRSLRTHAVHSACRSNSNGHPPEPSSPLQCRTRRNIRTPEWPWSRKGAQQQKHRTTIIIIICPSSIGRSKWSRTR